MTLRINSRHPTADHPLDPYWTPVEATRALMAIEHLPASIADPCCGSGAILDVLAEAGHVIHGADIVDYGWRPGCTVIRDYLAEPVHMGDTAIVTNPPFRLAEAFIRKAIADHCQYHAWLLRTNFLESVSRMKLWREYPPSRIWVSSRRLPMMHRHGWNGPRTTSNQAFCWMVWDDRTPALDRNDTWPRLDWFDWRESCPDYRGRAAPKERESARGRAATRKEVA